MRWEETPRNARGAIRDEAEKVLRESGEPLHYSRIAELVLRRLGLERLIEPKRVNDCLHEDHLHRFQRVGPGMWVVSRSEPKR